MGVWDMENILYFILLPIQQMSDISLQHCKGMLKTAVLPGRVSRPLLQHRLNMWYVLGVIFLLLSTKAQGYTFRWFYLICYTLGCYH